MDLNKLLESMPYKWRVQSFSKNKPSASCVAYVDARDVARRLDEACGVGNWQDDYKSAGNLLFCGIGIKVNNEWIWKWDTGTESNMEAEKGHASDAFKRAAVKWGVGRFLYDLDVVYLDANEVKTKTNFPYVVDKNGKRVWDITKHINSLQTSARNGQTRQGAGTPPPAPANKLDAVLPPEPLPELDKEKQTLLADLREFFPGAKLGKLAELLGKEKKSKDDQAKLIQWYCYFAADQDVQGALNRLAVASDYNGKVIESFEKLAKASDGRIGATYAKAKDILYDRIRELKGFSNEPAA